MALILTTCGGSQLSASAPRLEAATDAAWCVTKGAARLGGTITEPTVRAVVRGSSGDAVSLAFTYRGDSATTRELASGHARRQLGIKLRAQDSCNVIYVMWRLDPRPMLEVSVKRNPGQATHAECGAAGYTKLKPASSIVPPALEPGQTHTLRAAIVDDELIAWIGDEVAWRGKLPVTAHELVGPAGLRSDNVAFDLVELAVGAGAGTADARRCHAEDSD